MFQSPFSHESSIAKRAKYRHDFLSNSAASNEVDMNNSVPSQPVVQSLKERIHLQFQQQQQQSFHHLSIDNNNLAHHGNNIISRLLEAEMWLEAYIRCLSHPHECLPTILLGVPSKPVTMTTRKCEYTSSSTATNIKVKQCVPLYLDTPLGIACRKFTNKVLATLPPSSSTAQSPTLSTTNTTSNSSDIMTRSITQFDVIKALFQACPTQLICNQLKIGLTPLLDIICNPYATFEVTKLLIDADSYLSSEISDINLPCYNNHHDDGDLNTHMTETMAIGRRDCNGLSPLHHLVGQVHRNSTIVTEELKALDLIHYITQLHPSLIDNIPRVDVDPIDENNNNTQGKNHVHNAISPLIHLLSQKAGNQRKDEQFMPRITKCVHILLSSNPNLIKTKSIMTSCTPLHMALRNGYGGNTALIALLLRHDPCGYQVRQKNNFGDLPIHIIATIGTCDICTWSILLQHISITSKVEDDDNDSDKGKEHDPIHGPSSFIWATNSHGYTPLHLAWMRQINGKHPYPMSYTRNLHMSQRKGMYYDTLGAAVNEVTSLMNDEKDFDFDRIATDSLGPFWGVLKLFLKTFRSDPSSNHEDEGENFDNFLHATCTLIGPLLPRPIFNLIFTAFQDQVHELDSFDRVPLHYACASFSMVKESVVAFPSKTMGWYDMDCVTQVDDEMEQCTIQKMLFLNQKAASLLDVNGFLPLHFAIESEKSSKILDVHMDAYKTWSEKRANGHCTVNWVSLVMSLAKAYPDVLGMPVPNSGLYPFMLAAANPMGNSIEIVYCLLKMFPTTTNQVQN